MHGLQEKLEVNKRRGQTAGHVLSRRHFVGAPRNVTSKLTSNYAPTGQPSHTSTQYGRNFQTLKNAKANIKSGATLSSNDHAARRSANTNIMHKVTLYKKHDPLAGRDDQAARNYLKSQSTIRSTTQKDKQYGRNAGAPTSESYMEEYQQRSIRAVAQATPAQHVDFGTSHRSMAFLPPHQGLDKVDTTAARYQPSNSSASVYRDFEKSAGSFRAAAQPNTRDASGLMTLFTHRNEALNRHVNSQSVLHVPTDVLQSIRSQMAGQPTNNLVPEQKPKHLASLTKLEDKKQQWKAEMSQ